MTPDPDSSRSSKTPETPGNAGGFFIAAGGIAGVLIGGFLGQPSAGLLAGLALGAVVAIGMWLRNR